MKTISILLVDDHPIFRKGVLSTIEENKSFKVVGEAPTGKDAIRLARKHKPDIVTVDLSLPDINGIQLIKEIKYHAPDAKIMVISMYDKIDYVTKCLQAGAVGYVVKSSDSSKIIEGLKKIATGIKYIDSSLSNQLSEVLLSKIENKPHISKNDSKYQDLTPREQEVLRLMVDDLTNKEIGELLHISHKTVETHRSNILKKLNIKSGKELIRFAANIGLIDFELWKDGQDEDF